MGWAFANEAPLDFQPRRRSSRTTSREPRSLRRNRQRVRSHAVNGHQQPQIAFASQFRGQWPNVDLIDAYELRLRLGIEDRQRRIAECYHRRRAARGNSSCIDRQVHRLFDGHGHSRKTSTAYGRARQGNPAANGVVDRQSHHKNNDSARKSESTDLPASSPISLEPYARQFWEQHPPRAHQAAIAKVVPSALWQW